VQILQGLAAAHAEGIVHRDIKPSNVIVLDSGLVKVTDFGIARLDSVGISQHGMMVGTPSYMAPEQFTGGDIDRRTDLFAVGVLLYEMLTGEKPFPGNTVTEVMYRVMHHPPRDPADYNVRLSPALRAVLMKALERDPAMRFQTAESFASALQQELGAPAEVGGREELATVIETVASSLPRTPPPEQAAAAGDLDAAALRRAEEDLASFIGPVAKVIVRNAAGKVDSVSQLYDSLATHITQERERSAFLRKAARAAMGLSTGTGTDGGTGRTGRTGSGTGTGGRGTGMFGRGRGTGPGSGTAGTSGTGTAGTGASGTGAAPGGPGATGAGLSGTGAGAAGDGIPEAEIDRARQALTVHLGPIAGVLVKKTAPKAASVAELYRLLAEHIPNPTDRSKFLQSAGWI
jgi:serine/threonine-protein kinase